MRGWKPAAGAAVLALLAAGGIWFWRTQLAVTASLPREPLSAGELPKAAQSLELETLLPEGSFWILGAPQLGRALDDFRASNLYKQYDVMRSSSQAQAQAAFGKAAGGSEPALDEISRLLGQGFALALYPRPPAAPAFSGAPPKAQASLLLVAKVALPFTWTGSPLEPLLRMATDDVYRDVPLKVLPFASAGVADVQGKGYLLVGNDLALVKRAIDLLGQPLGVGASAARAPWLQEAAKRVPADSFLYVVANDRAAREMAGARGAGKLPNPYDWTALSLSWTAGLHSLGFAHYAADMEPAFAADWKRGPASYPVLDLLPPDDIFVVASNSLAAKTWITSLRRAAEAMTQQPKPVQQFLSVKWEELAGGIGEQAVVGALLNKGDAASPLGLYALVQLTRPFGAGRKLEAALAALQGVTQSVKSVDSVGECRVLTFGDAPKAPSLLYRLEGRWLVVAADEATMKAVVGQTRHKAAALFVPPEYAAKSNMLGFVDYGALAKAFPAKTSSSPLGPLLEWLGSIKPGWFAVTHETEGSRYRFDLPLEDAPEAEWARRLAPLQAAMTQTALLRARAKVQALAGKALAELRVGLYKHKKAAGRFPSSLRQLVPRDMPSIPADPLTGATRDVRAPDAGGGWLYDPKTGAVALNTTRTDLGAGASAAGANAAALMASVSPADRAALQALGAVRMAVISYRARSGRFPDSLAALGAVLPLIDTHACPASREQSIYATRLGPLRGTGGWGYVADHTSREWGSVFIDCSKPDSAGRPWYRY